VLGKLRSITVVRSSSGTASAALGWGSTTSVWKEV